MTREEILQYIKSELANENAEIYLDVDDYKIIVKALEQEPTTKNDLGVDANKLLADCEKMSFDIEIFNKPLKVVALDAVKNIAKDLINSENPNKSEILIGSTTKNDLAVECIVDVLGSYTDLDIPYKREIAENILTKLSSVTPQEPQSFKWCETCKEYDQEKHCCHRYSKVIRNTVEEMKQDKEPVLDKIREEIKAMTSNRGFLSCSVGYIHKEIDNVFDKYKSESEPQESEDKMDKEWEVEASIEIKTSFWCKTKEEAEKMANDYLTQLCQGLYPDCCSNSYEIDDIYSYTED